MGKRDVTIGAAQWSVIMGNGDEFTDVRTTLGDVIAFETMIRTHKRGTVGDNAIEGQAFTVWRPTGWKTPAGLFLAADASVVARIYGSLDKRTCARYEALLLPGKKVTSVFYVFRDKVWGFGLMRPDASPCL